VGALLLLAAAMNLWRLFRWRGWATTAEPLLLILHLGYGWLAVGAGLLGLSMLGLSVLGWAVPQSAAIHALTAGAAGSMILAVMTRASRGHTGHALAADGPTRLIYLLVNGAALARVVAAFGPWPVTLLFAAAGLWIAAFGLFCLAYGPMLLLPGRGGGG
jgi:uncharacterized protein involved in response to NO